MGIIYYDNDRWAVIEIVKHVFAVMIIFAATGPSCAPTVPSHLDIQDSCSVNDLTTDLPSWSLPSRVILSRQVVLGAPPPSLDFPSCGAGGVQGWSQQIVWLFETQLVRGTRSRHSTGKGAPRFHTCSASSFT